MTSRVVKQRPEDGSTCATAVEEAVLGPPLLSGG